MAAKMHWMNPIRHTEADEVLSMWVTQVLESNDNVTGDVIHEKWRRFATFLQMHKNEWPVLSKGWLTRFKDWNGLKKRKEHGKAVSQNTSKADAGHKRGTVVKVFLP